MQLLFLILLLESMLLFLLAPTGHSYWFAWLCMIQYLVSTVVYVVVVKKKNYFDFDVIFLLTFFFIMFFFPVFMYGTDLEFVFFAFSYDYNHDVISRATALSLLAGQSYLFGALMVNKERIKAKPVKPVKIIPNGILTIEVLICFVLFFVVAGSELFTTQYGANVEPGSAAKTYMQVLLGALLMSALVIEFNNWVVGRRYCKKWILFLIMAIFIMVFLMIGSRTAPLQYGLLTLGLFSLKIKTINFKMFMVLVVTGMVAMGVVGMMRVSDSNMDAVEDMKEKAGPVFYLQDLVLNNRNTFMAVDMVDKDGVDYGVGMLTTVLGVVPFGNSMVLNFTPLTELDMSSGLRITAKSLGKTSNYDVGFGTNIVASVYMSFGMIGVIVFLFVLGYMVNFAMFKTKYQNDIYYLLFYAVLMANSVYLVRSEYFFFLRSLVWGLIIVNIAKLHPYTLKFRLVNRENNER